MMFPPNCVDLYRKKRIEKINVAAVNHWGPHRLGPCRPPQLRSNRMLIQKFREKGQTFTLCLTEPSETACQLMQIWVTSEVTTWATFDVWTVRDSVAHLSKTTPKMLSRLRIYIPLVVFPEVSSPSGYSKTVSHDGTTLVTRSKSSSRATLGLRSSWLVEKLTAAGLQQLKRCLLGCTQHYFPSF